jgi:hypothetical protein
MSSSPRPRRQPAASPLAKLRQKFLCWYEERILLEHTADDDHWMRPHDVDYRIASESRKIVCADDRVFVAAPHIIDARFELNNIIDV